MAHYWVRHTESRTRDDVKGNIMLISNIKCDVQHAEWVIRHEEYDNQAADSRQIYKGQVLRTTVNESEQER